MATVNALTPIAVPTQSSTKVLILGDNLSADPSLCAAILPIGTSNAGDGLYELYYANQSDPSDVYFTAPAGKLAGTYLVCIFASPDNLYVNNALYQNSNFTYYGGPELNTASQYNGSMSGGTSITLTGTNLLDASSVTFGDVDASFTVVSSTEIICISPPSSSFGPVSINVTTPDGSTSAYPLTFTYGETPIISSVSPNSGSYLGGTEVTINGEYFFNINDILFGNVSASIIASDPSGAWLKCATPAAGNVGPVNVSVSSMNFGTATASNAFTYGTPPTITSVPTLYGNALGGTDITINGTNFVGGATTVTIGGNAATVVGVINNNTQIIGDAPSGAAGTTGNITVNTPYGSVTYASQFTFGNVPTITSVSPTNVSTLGGTQITISGTDFVLPLSVTFGSENDILYNVSTTTVTIDASNISNYGATITCNAPAGAAGVSALALQSNYGLSNIYSITYVPLPTIGSLTPNTGSNLGGTQVTIQGTNMFDVSFVLFDGSNVAVTSSDPSGAWLTFTTPAGNNGPASVSLTTAYGTATATNAFTYGAPPTITSLSPATGSNLGGTEVTINGANFFNVSSVKFDGSNVAVISTDSSGAWLKCTTLPGNDGAVKVDVITPYGRADLDNAFMYGPPPTITSLSQSTGSTAGGTEVTIGGTNFIVGLTSVSFNGGAALITAISSTQIIVLTPAGVAGLSDVTVNTSFGTATASNAFTYVVPIPIVTSCAPSNISSLSPVTIYGANFLGATSVTFDGYNATNIIVVNNGQINCDAPVIIPTPNTPSIVVVTTPIGSSTPTPESTASAASRAGGTATTVTPPGSMETGANRVTYTPSVPHSDICFPKGTLIVTNQGKVAIENINPAIHTIRNKKIEAITKTVSQDKHLICFEKHSLGNNVPSQKTNISRNHAIFYNGKMMQAKEFIGKFDNVYKTKYNGEVLYNVLMETHDKMMVNNLICETLDPENCVAKLYMELKKYDINEQQILIKQLNEYVDKKNMLKSKK